MSDLPKTVSARDLGRILGVSDRAIRRLHDRGIIPKTARSEYVLEEGIQAYCEHLRTVAAGRGGEDAQLSLSQERARLAKEQADREALKNARSRGELVEVQAVEKEWSDILRTARSRILAVPSRLSSRIGHLSQSDIRQIDDEIRMALLALANNDDSVRPP